MMTDPERAAPFTGQKTPPDNGSWPILMIGFGPVSRPPPRRAAGMRAGAHGRSGRIDLRKLPDARRMAAPEPPARPPVSACRVIIKSGQEPNLDEKVSPG